MWTTQPVVLEDGPSSWTRMVQLPDGSWLAAYMYATTPNRIRVKRSFDAMRTWQWVSEIVEAGRDLDNPALCIRSDGTVLLAFRSVIVGQSYRIETYTSGDSGNSFQYQSLVDWDEHLGGVYEPYLYVLPDGSIACFYTSEKHRFDTPPYSQILSERVSRDGGQTWGPEIWAISQAGAARPGEANIVPLTGSVLALFYEMCGTENCVGHVSYSTDGVTWPGIGPALPDTFQDVQAVGLPNGLIFATSNFRDIIMSTDYTNSWFDTRQHPFRYGVWPALYQTGPNEIAMVMTGAGEHGEQGQYIRFGTINRMGVDPVTSIDTCVNPTRTRPQNCR
ncbi:MAG TPA: sialidase family protein [Bryobacteraceae bacterium]|nr:sialidase family protein [Bryobacteraceae bacterium]